jgi:hypothetical protein
MNKEEQINFIREKCIEANPEIKRRFVFICRHGEEYQQPDVIRLADVLLATNNAVRNMAVQDFGALMLFSVDEDTDSLDWNEVMVDGKRRHWNLRADDLRQQSEETINFLYDLLK